MGNKLKIGIILDNKVNKWALQRFEPLKDKYDITVFVGQRNGYDITSIELKKVFLSHSREIALLLQHPVEAYKRVLRAPYKRMDFYYFSLQKYLKDMDVVYTCDLMRSAYTLACLKEKFRYKLIVSWWENIPYRSVFDKKMDFYKNRVMDKVDLFLPFTRAAKTALQIEGVADKKLKVIYPGVDLERFSPGEKPLHLMNKLNIPETSFIILYVGKLVSWKGVHNLIYMAKILKERGIENFSVAVAGKGAQKENMKKIMQDSGTEDHFRFLDFVSYDDMPDVHRMADVLVLPSYPIIYWQEQFGMVLAEAMASGTPIISTLTGSIPEVLGDAAMLIPPGDFAMLADNVIKLMEDRLLREELCRKGRERAERMYDADRVSGEFARVLKEI
ncbi:MAG TPA: glycosyltransferase family 1 protein [Nitrospirae bacterium]|nr:glycosyltransferase family 1 protein [Nitrospirota bacterium]